MRQFCIIMAVTCVGEVLRYFIPLPVPASVYGLILMFLLLVTGILKVSHVKETGIFLIEIMPLMFIPAAAGLLVSLGQLKAILLPVCVITVVSTFIVMAVSGKTTELLLKWKKNK